MTRSITRTLPLIAALFSFILLSSTSNAQLLGKHHYSNRMYVKVDKQKHEADQRSAEVTTRTTDAMSSLPQRNVNYVANTSSQPKASKLSIAVANVLHPRTKTQSASTAQVNSKPTTNPLMVQTVNYTRDETTAAAPSDDATLLHILVIIGIILIIAAIISLILSVTPAGWVSLLVLGLLIILIAYLVL